jgi:hypothetical protein
MVKVLPSPFLLAIQRVGQAALSRRHLSERIEL